MALVWNEIKPKDGFRVSLKSLLSQSQLRTLTHLYQPLIGSLSYALYLTLANEVEGERIFSVEKNHQWLMNLMNAPLDAIYHARLKLEALGLMKSYLVTKDEHQTLFEYELFHPFTPEQFFADDLLSICLYNQVGAQRYRDLRMRYSTYYVANGGEQLEKKEITKEFHQVFNSLAPSELVALKGSEMNEQISAWTNQYPLASTARTETSPPKFDQYELDLDVLKSSLMKGLDPASVINQQTIPVLKKIAYFYQLDAWVLGSILHDALDYHEQLDLELLREKAKEWYRYQEGGQPPVVVPTIQPKQKPNTTSTPQESQNLSEEERHMLQLEQISPIQLLEQFQRGGKVAEADIKLAEELLFEYKLEPPVVNLLLEYIFYTNNYKLPRNLVTKVAAHWKRFNVQTIREAQVLALKEQEQYKEWQRKQEEKERQGKRIPSGFSSGASQQVRKDKLPPWIEAQQKKETEEQQQVRQDQQAASKQGQDVKAAGDEDSEARRKRIQQKLQELAQLKMEGGR